MRNGKAPAPRAAAVIEPLEARTLLSGDVTVWARGKNLYISGDGADNSVIIEDSLLATHELRITGLDGTLINGSESILVPIKGQLRISMAAGADTLRISGLANGTIDVDAGTGDNLVDILGGRTVTVRTGAGNSQVTASNTGLTTLLLGNGSTDVQVSGSLTRLNMVTGSGSHRLTVAASVRGDVRLSNGLGDSTTTIRDSVISGGVYLTNKAGADDLQLLDTIVRGSMTVANGSGPSTARVGSDNPSGRVSNTILRSLSFSSGDGADVVQIGQAQVQNFLTIDTGSGGSDVLLESMQAPRVLNVRGTAGADNVTLRNMVNPATFSASILTGAGDDSITLDGLTAARVQVQSGAGDDRFVLEPTNPLGARTNYSGLDVRMEGGNDQIVLGWAGMDSCRLSSASFQGGDGDDSYACCENLLAMVQLTQFELLAPLV